MKCIQFTRKKKPNVTIVAHKSGVKRLFLVGWCAMKTNRFGLSNHFLYGEGSKETKKNVQLSVVRMFVRRTCF